jgi:pullulanase/glycogen debranching enzyme
MSAADWHDAQSHAFTCSITSCQEPGSTRSAARLLLLFNAESRPINFQLPPGRWQLVLDTSLECIPGADAHGVAPLHVPARALLVLRRTGT